MCGPPTGRKGENSVDVMDKLTILADAAKYDAACTSSGVTRGAKPGTIGTAANSGCCHTFSADGRCVSHHEFYRKCNTDGMV